MIEAETQEAGNAFPSRMQDEIENLRLDFAFRVRVNCEVETQAPAEDAEDERADEAGLVEEEE